MADIHGPTGADTGWFLHDRFGMFIHWGIYALAARHEWVKNYEKLTDEDYENYFKYFDPDLYDPNIWAQAASDAGMKYFVITTKHHDGFCLWDSKLTDYKATNTPAGRDLIRPMVDAFRAKNLRVGLYHSLLDWHHPDFTIDTQHPQRDHPDKDKMNVGRDMARYREYLHGQVREILTQFGKIDTFFFDYSYAWEPEGKGREAWDSEKLYKLVRELQPHIILNDRLNMDYGWDTKTPEQVTPRGWVTVDGKRVMWETCQTFSGSWGYHRDEQTWKSVDQLVRMLIDTVSKGGNLLLNVGPTARGEFDYRALNALAGIGEWMKRHNRSIYGCTAAPDDFPTPPDCRLTYNPEKNRLYIHVFAWPTTGHLHIEGFGERIAYAQLLNDGSEVRKVTRYHAQSSDGRTDQYTFALPVVKPHVTVPVIEVFLK